MSKELENLKDFQRKLESGELDDHYSDNGQAAIEEIKSTLAQLIEEKEKKHGAILLVEVYEDGPNIEFYEDTEEGLTEAKSDYLDVIDNDCTASEVALFRVNDEYRSITSDTNMSNGQYEITGKERLFYFRNDECNY